MSRFLIRNGRLLDPWNDVDRECDVLVEDGRISAIAPDAEIRGAELFDASGCWVAPGFIDMHCHLREPGQEYKEDLASGGRAAVAGGFTAVACMANTNPVNDDPAVTDFIIGQAHQGSPARVYPIAAATRGLAGEVITEMSALRDSGAVAFSDDGETIMNSGVMRSVLEYSTLVGVPIIVHAEDLALVAGGVVNEGPISTRLGLPGNPTAAEDVHVARDLELASLTGARLHVAHVSSAGAVELIRRAKEAGIQVTAEVTPHHLTLTEEATLGYDTNTKMAPPLRSAEDRAACRKGLAEGILDAVATDHAPHAVHEKEVDFIEAPCGVLGLETAFAVVLDLVRTGELTPMQLIRAFAQQPARILGVPGGRLGEVDPADFVVLDPERRWTYDTAKGYSKSRNSPWDGEELTGRVIATFVAGDLVYHADRGVLMS